MMFQESQDNDPDIDFACGNDKENDMLLANIATKIGKRIIISRNNRHYDNLHKKEVQRALSNMASFNKQVLSKQLKTTADNYAEEILGSKRFAPWLHVYTLISGEFKEGWIPDNFFGRVVAPRIYWRLPHITTLKTFTNRLLQTDALPDIAYYLDGVLYDKTMSIINIGDLRKLTDGGKASVFIKSDGSGRGLRIIRTLAKDIDADLLKRAGDCVIQETINQHEKLAHIISSTVATIRLTSVKEKDGNVTMRASYLRLGRKNTSWIQQEYSITVAIVSQDGDLDSYGYTPDWRRWSFHPDTNFPFAGYRVPRYQEAVALCISLHRTIPHIPVIGWDITVAQDETVKLLEWNSGHPEIKFTEATVGPSFIGLDWERFKD